MTYMLDTNICIYAMKNKPEHVLQRLKKELNSGVCISSITLAELEYGMKHSSNPAKNEQALLRFLIPLSILPFGAAAASEYGEIRSYLQDRGTPIGPLDTSPSILYNIPAPIHLSGDIPSKLIISGPSPAIAFVCITVRA